MDIRNYIEQSYKDRYSITKLKGKSLLEWAAIWFKTDNDTFFNDYGFNFNPHEYPFLYEIARKDSFCKFELDYSLDQKFSNEMIRRGKI